jgi:CHAD domain-containing protein
LVRRFFRAARKAAESDSPRNLHRLRLEAKRLRYTLELFESLYGPALQRRLAQLRKLQGYLGDISDIGTTSAMFNNGADRRRIEVARLQDYLRSRLADRLAAFRRYWKTVMDAPGERERWMAYVARFARPERSSSVLRSKAKSA